MTDQSRGAHSSSSDPSGSAATPRQRVLNDRYELGSLIGRGGMADVWRGRDLLLGRDVAVKILRSDLARDPVFQARFRREAKAVAGLNDPSIVAVYDTGDTDVQIPGEAHSLKVPFIVMEYVSGHTLKERLQGGPLPLQDAANATLGVLAALTSSHAQSIVHRDIKPANVMITDAGAVKVMDFGIARALADSAATMTQTQAVVGTAQYLSPEQARGESVDERSDLYSAGCLLFELLTGRPPFLGDSPVSVAYQHVGEQPPVASSINPAVTPAMDAVLARALTKDRTQRFQSAHEFSLALRAALRGEVLPATQATQVIAASPEATQAMSMVPTAAFAANASPAGALEPEHPAASTGRLDAVLGDPESGERGFFEDENDPQQRKASSRRTAIVWIVSVLLLGLIVAGGLLIWNWMSAEAEKNARVEIPVVASKTLEAAKQDLAGQGFTNITSDEVFSDDVAKGLVTDTDPAAGTQSLKSAPITVHVSKGPAAVVIPKDLAGKTEAEARKILAELDLKVADATKEVDGKDIPRGNVVNTSPALGKSVDVGSTVTLQISKGEVKIPEDLVGVSEAEAKAALEKLGFKVASPSKQVNGGDAEAGSVVGLDPKPGSSQPYGTTITLEVAKKKTQIPTTLVGQDEAAVRTTLTSLGLSNITSESVNSSKPLGTVISIDPAGGTAVTDDAQIKLSVSNGKVKMPDVVTQDLAAATQLLQGEQYGLQVSVTQVNGDDEQQGKVLGQSIVAGTEIPAGTQVVLQVGE